MSFKIHIRIGEKVFTFTTNFYRKGDGRIYFTDKFGQPKNFADTPEVLIGIEEVKP